MWKDPEFNNELVFFALVDDLGPPSGDPTGQHLDIYRQINGTWQKINTIAPAPPNRPNYYSPEPFVYNGKSYIFFTAAAGGNGSTDADVWIAAIDPAAPLSRQVSASTPGKRFDPEVLILTGGPVIYYTENSSNGVRLLHRSATGL